LASLTLVKSKLITSGNKVNTHIYGKETLVKRLSQKYGLEYNTAETWIFEFKKFFTLKLLEAEFEADWDLLPCSIVECVWSTYIELGVTESSPMLYFRIGLYTQNR